jgi:hypothetical protein
MPINSSSAPRGTDRSKSLALLRLRRRQFGGSKARTGYDLVECLFQCRLDCSVDSRTPQHLKKLVTHPRRPTLGADVIERRRFLACPLLHPVAEQDCPTLRPETSNSQTAGATGPKRPWLDRELASPNRTPLTQTGFGAEVNQAMERRKDRPRRSGNRQPHVRGRHPRAQGPDHTI